MQIPEDMGFVLVVRAPYLGAMVWHKDIANFVLGFSKKSNVEWIMISDKTATHVLRFACEYDGSGFYGFQIQKDLPTIQQSLEDTFKHVLGEKVSITPSGRTDTGVHAYRQVCHAVLPSPPSQRAWGCLSNLYKLQSSVNHFLPSTIAIKDLERAPDGFHARYSAKSKTYCYKCYISPVSSPLRDSYMLRLNAQPNISKMNKAAKYLVGTYDFSAFTTASNPIEDKVRTIYSLTIKLDGDELSFFIRGNGFLHNMVRVIVGTLVNIGLAKLPPDSILEILDSKNRDKAGPTASAHGLYLLDVEY